MPLSTYTRQMTRQMERNKWTQQEVGLGEQYKESEQYKTKESICGRVNKHFMRTFFI